MPKYLVGRIKPRLCAKIQMYLLNLWSAKIDFAINKKARLTL